MATNGLTIAGGTADIEVSDGTNTYGYVCKSPITEVRASQFAAATGSGAPTYKDASIFTREAWETFGGGFGQEQYNKIFGGQGAGGDMSKYLFTDGLTLNGARLLPGLRRQYACYAPASNNLGQEISTPNGVIPCNHPAGMLTKFTLASPIGISDVFNRPDSNTTLGNAFPTGQAWTAVLGTWGISSNQGYSVTDANGDLATINSGFADGTIQCDVSGTLNNATVFRLPVVFFRGIDVNNFLYVQLLNGNVQLAKRDAGTFTVLSTVAQTTADGTVYTVKVVYSGTSIQVFINGVSKITYTLAGGDATKYLSTTQIGFYLAKSGAPATAARFDNLLVTRTFKMRVLAKFDVPGVYNFNAWLRDNPDPNNPYTFGFTFSASIDTTAAPYYTGFKWVTLTSTTQQLLPANDYYIRTFPLTNQSYGCFVGTLDGNANVLQPYAQLLTVAGKAPYDWTATPVATETLYDTTNGRRQAFHITSKTWANGSFAPNAETAYADGNTYTGSCVFDNKLYISTTANIYTWSDTAAIAQGAATATKASALSVMISHAGQIFGTNSQSVYKWDGGAGAVTAIINNDTIGKKNTNNRNPLNNLMMHNGLMYVLKPEGIFKVNADINTVAAATLPDIQKVVDLEKSGLEDVNNGKYCIEYNGFITFNVLNQVYMFKSLGANGNQLISIVPPLPRGRSGSNNIVNGLATDGDTLFVSVANIGVLAYTPQGWHWIAEFYEINTTGAPSGLRYLYNCPAMYDQYRASQPGAASPVGNWLVFADGNAQCLIPIVNSRSYYTQQIFRSGQQKAGYFISSMWDGNLAEILKWLYSITLVGWPQGYSFKMVPALYTSSGTASFSGVVETAVNAGLYQDKWVNPTTVSSSTLYPAVVTGPAQWTASDLTNQYFSSEKQVSVDHVAEPVQAAKLFFILYWWKPEGTQDGFSTYNEISSIESWYLKFLATLDYLGVWQTTLDLTFNGDFQLDLTTTEASINFLRNAIKSKTPNTIKFYDVTGTLRTVTGIFQNPNASAFPHTRALQGEQKPGKTYAIQWINLIGE